jgi:hypothetical protein
MADNKYKVVCLEHYDIPKLAQEVEDHLNDYSSYILIDSLKIQYIYKRRI